MPSTSLAGTLNASQLPTITMQVQGSPSVWDWSQTIDKYTAAPSTDPDGGYELSTQPHYSGVCNGTTNLTIQQLQFNSDPFVLNNLLVTNTTATTQIYSVTVSLPTSFGAPNLISGNITTSVIDGGDGSATVSTVSGQPIYKAQIDFNPVAGGTLQNDPFSITTSTSSAQSASFGPTLSAIPVNSNIGIAVTFQLTPGDTASILSRFNVVSPVPEPSSLVLAGLAAAFGFVVIGRRYRLASM
jgi:hypothetical protein